MREREREILFLPTVPYLCSLKDKPRISWSIPGDVLLDLLDSLTLLSTLYFGVSICHP